jgi:hypothetical protein
MNDIAIKNKSKINNDLNKNLFGEEFFVVSEDLIKVADNIFKKYQQYIKYSNNDFNSLLLLNEIILESIKANNQNKCNLNEIINKTNIKNFNAKDENVVYLKKIVAELNLIKLFNTNKSNINIIFGYVFEKLITKKESGAYYTDIKTTSYITENSIIANIISQIRRKSINFDNHIKSIEKNYNIDFIEKSIKDGDSIKNNFIDLIDICDKKEITSILSNLKIIDISCGAGSFIFSAFYLLKEIYKKLCVNISTERIFNDNLFGIDIDHEAISLLQFRIQLECIIDNSFYNDLSTNFIVGNCLLGNQKGENKLFINENIENIFLSSEKIKNIITSGGFDIVLGNPPYLEYKKVVNDYQIENFISQKCNNLYAFVLEKNFDILKDNGHLGMIVPISYISTKRMTPIRNLLIKNSKYHFCSSFADRPSCLFNGVHQKLNIILLEKESNTKSINHYTSSYIHWYSNEKDNLFNEVNYSKNDFYQSEYLFKVGKDIEKSIINKIIFKNEKPLLANISNNGNHKIWLNMRMCFWVKAFTFRKKSNEYKVFSFNNELDAFLFTAITNSNLFFFFWESISDVWHITQKDLNAIQLDFSKVENHVKSEIKYLYQIFEENLEKNKVEINSKQTDFEYKHKNEKTFIDKFDAKICELFYLTQEEIEYIKNYQIRYRMNGELNSYLKAIQNECN